MSNILNWDQFLEAKEKDLPNQVSDKDRVMKAQIKVAEKDKTTPLGDEATPALKSPEANICAGKKPDYSCQTTESFVKSTQHLSDSDFIKEMLKESVEEESLTEDKKDEDDEGKIPKLFCQLSGKEIVPSAHEVSKLMAHILPKNDKAARIFMGELKRVPGGLKSLMNEMVGHNEMFDEMVDQMGMNESKVSRKLVNSMQNNHQKFMTELGLMSIPNGGMSMGESVDVPINKRLGDAGLPTKQTPPEMPAPVINDMPGDGKDAVGITSSTKENEPETPQMKVNKEFAYHHMIKEMRKYPNMSEAMNEGIGSALAGGAIGGAVAGPVGAGIGAAVGYNR